MPQGSVLGPLLFLVYINDLERNIKSNVKFFADDTMIFSIVKNPEIYANDLDHDLDVIHQWTNQWKLEFKPDPTKQTTEVFFSLRGHSTFKIVIFLFFFKISKYMQSYVKFIVESTSGICF